MKDPITTPGRTYAVTSPNGCTVTTEEGLTLAEIEAGKQGYFVAVSGKVLLSDEAAVLTQLFKLAPQQRLAILGVLGGNAGLPAGYKRVEYLERTETQYINTNWIVETPISIETTCYLPQAGNAYICATLSREYSGDVAQHRFLFGASDNRILIDMGCGWLRYSNAGGIFNLKLNVAELRKKDAITLYTNGQLDSVYQALSAQATPYESVNPLYLFCCNSNGTASGGVGVRIYSLTISVSGRKKFDFVPCLDETGAPCMFDKVKRKAYYNEGTGDFLYPTESTAFSFRRVLPDWGKLTEHGLRRLYHAPDNYTGELYDYALENGYKPIIEPEQPETGYWAPRWTETEDEIVLEWVETEPPAEDLTETE